VVFVCSTITQVKNISCLFSHVDMDFTSRNIVVLSRYVTVLCGVWAGKSKKFQADKTME
jgi:hypothetical protein